jgi:hypothetical protein
MDKSSEVDTPFAFSIAIIRRRLEAIPQRVASEPCWFFDPMSYGS